MVIEKKRINKKGARKQACFIVANLILSVFAFSFLVSLTPFITAETYDLQTVDFDKIDLKNNDIVKIGDTSWVFKPAASGSPSPFSTTDPTGRVYSASWKDMTGWQKIAQEKGNSIGNPSISTTPTTGGSSKLSTTLGIKDVGKEFKLVNGELVGSEKPAEGFFKMQTGSGIDAILSGAQWAVLTYGAIKMFGGFLGLEKETTDALAKAAAFGMFTGKSLAVLLGEKGAWSATTSGWNQFFTLGGKLSTSFTPYFWGGLITIVIFLSTYKKESMEVVSFTCSPWDAPTGGAKCEECNKQGILPCSEYQCRSLGQSCELLNPGTGEEKCAWVNRKDVNPPEIKPWDDALLPDYKYNPDNTISPPDRGVKIVYSKSTIGCIKAFSPFTFGIITNEPAKCKIDYNLNKANFSNMEFWFGGSSTFKYNHSQIMSLPGPSALKAENLTLENDGQFSLFTRCQDSNGNANTANFVFKYCVEKGPDTTPPLIISTSLLNGMPIAFNQSSVDLEVYTNEPATCKWSHLDQSYDKMEETMTCSSSVFEMNAQMLYKCKTTLTGLKDRTENKFYFRCKDNPLLPENEKNANSESYKFSLIGTQPLYIDSVKPNETVKDSTESVKVTLEIKTSAGYKEGKATCYYSETGNDDSYVMFFKTESHEHSQDLYLTKGDYTYYLKCIDLGGNQDTNKTQFKVESDTEAPTVARVYHDESYLKVITNEDAECVYDTTNCNYLFDDGINLVDIDGKRHYTDWNTKVNFYIKCKDEYNNQPSPNECSIIARPIEIYSGE